MEEPGDVLDRLNVALDKVQSAPVSSWSPEEIADWWSRVQSMLARMDALCVDAALAAHMAGVPLAES